MMMLYLVTTMSSYELLSSCIYLKPILALVSDLLFVIVLSTFVCVKCSFYTCLYFVILAYHVHCIGYGRFSSLE